MKLWTLPASFRSSACLCVLDACGVDYSTEWVGFEDLHTEKINRLNPQGKVPVLETSEGALYELSAILRYISRKSGHLGGANDFEAAQIDQWMSWLNSEIGSVLPHFLFQVFGFEFPFLSYKPDEITKGKDTFVQRLGVLNAHLQGRKAVVGNDYTIADWMIASFIYQPIAFCLSDKERNSIKDVITYLDGISQTTHFQKWFGRLRYSSHPLKAPAPPKKAEKPKEEKKKEEKPKEEKKKAPKDDDDDIEKPPKKEEPKFPDTQLNLMTFKTFFINEPNFDTALEKFWSDFKEGEWSLWHLKYIKYPGECEIVYRTNNLLRTFMSRLDDVRKYIFGTHMVLGDEPALEIEGVWLIRGPAIFEGITEIDVYDTYKWDKLDSTNPEHRALVKDFWTHRKEDEQQVQGKTIRTFKWIK